MIARRIWWGDGAAAVIATGEQIHVFAAGADAPPAVALATSHPHQVLSLVLVEPGEADQATLELLPHVGVPTLVLASAPTETTDLTVAQRYAGEIDNGVFVILDGTAKPAHTEKPESFDEWSRSFIVIAEGVAAQDGRLLTPPTPLLEGVIS